MQNSLPLSAHSTQLSFSSGLSTSTSGSLGSINANADANSPEIFRQNIKTAQQYIDIIQRLARNCLSGM